jgi:hypothetical protein
MVWKPIREKLRHFRQTMKHSGGSMMIWGCMAIHNIKLMVRISKHPDQHLYKQILAEALLKTMTTYGIVTKDATFQHDNDPKHTSKR